MRDCTIIGISAAHPCLRWFVRSTADMAAFRSLTADRLPFKPYSVAANDCNTKLFSRKGRVGNADLPLHLYEWSQSSQDGVEVSGIRSVSDLEARDIPTVRVV
jgi:hypothetical protein